MNPNPARQAQLQTWLAEHRGILVRVARAFTPTPADAAELEQEMTVQLWNSIPAFAGTARASTWIYRVCLNTALAWSRAERRRTRRLEPERPLHAVPADSVSPADQALRSDLVEQLYAAIHRMLEFDRSLILLMLDGLSYQEIAEVTGLTENHVGVALTRARKRLAALMKGVTDELE